VPVDIPPRRPQVAPLRESDSFSVPSFYKQLAKLESPLLSDVCPTLALEVGMPPRVVDPALARAATMRGDGVMHVRVRVHPMQSTLTSVHQSLTSAHLIGQVIAPRKGRRSVFEAKRSKYSTSMSSAILLDVHTGLSIQTLVMTSLERHAL
jgi:hypothetical protein